MTRNVVRILVVGILIAISVAGAVLASEELKNTSSETAVALRVEFSRLVRITSHGREFRTQEPSGRAKVFLFSDGSVRRRRTFEIEWSPGSARIVSVEWLSESDLIPPEPVSDMILSAAYGEAPISIVFEAKLENADPSAARFEWDFGDGASDVGQNVDHVFQKMGVYRVTLTAYPSDNVMLVTEKLIAVSPVYADANAGSDFNGDGSKESPYRTISRALQDVGSGRAVLIAEGIYGVGHGELSMLALPEESALIGMGVSREGVQIAVPITCGSNSAIVHVLCHGTIYPEYGSKGILLKDISLVGTGSGIDYGLYANSDSGFTLQDTSVSGFATAIYIVHPGTAVSVINCEITARFAGVWVGGRASAHVLDSRITDATRGISVVEDSRALIQGNQITSNFVGVRVEDGSVADLGGGPLGSEGLNYFAQNKEHNIEDYRMAYSGALYAVHNTWKDLYTPPEGSLDGPAKSYNVARVYIESPGNFVVFSD